MHPANGIAGQAAGGLDGSSAAVFPLPPHTRLPVQTPDGGMIPFTDPDALVLCRHCGRAYLWRSRPTATDPCTWTTHELIDGRALFAWTMQRFGALWGNYIDALAVSEPDHYHEYQQHLHDGVEALRVEMIVQFSLRAERWWQSALKATTEYMEAWAVLDGPDAVEAGGAS